MHHRSDVFCQLVRKQVGDPNETASAAGLVDDLCSAVVMPKRVVDDGPNDAPVGFVDVDDEFTDNLTVAERDDARASL